MPVEPVCAACLAVCVAVMSVCDMWRIPTPIALERRTPWCTRAPRMRRSLFTAGGRGPGRVVKGGEVMGGAQLGDKCAEALFGCMAIGVKRPAVQQRRTTPAKPSERVYMCGQSMVHLYAASGRGGRR